MSTYEFSLVNPLTFHFCGKFEAPTPEWMHMTRTLLDFELFVVTDGTLYIGDHRGQYEIHKGEAFIMAPTNKQYGYQSSNCSFYWLHFGLENEFNANSDNPALYREVNPDDSSYVLKSNHILVPSECDSSATDRIIVLMKQLQDSDKRYHEKLLNNYLTTCILCEISNQNFLSKKYGTENSKNQLYNDIVDYILWHICENIKIAEIAEYFGYNEKYLSTFFHKRAGMPLKQFILQTKMDHAKVELSDTNRTISQIAFNIGFSDAHNFTNAFKKITGLTPTEYRISYAKRQLFYE
ncbi:MAG: helix-turn-helix transcriptional regulator [Lachnospiraceae bacterium]|nr:helix-turn-helix transcriptional regulator [Lachnospiraceae bacterium]